MTRFSIHHPKCAIGHHDGYCMDASGMAFDGFPQTKEEAGTPNMKEMADAALTKQLMLGLLKLLAPLDDKRIQRLLAEDGVSIKWIELQEYLELCRKLYAIPVTIEAEQLTQVDASGTIMALPIAKLVPIRGLLPGGPDEDDDFVHRPWGGM